MNQTFSDLLNWSFAVDEISAGIYRVTAKDNAGRIISFDGIHPEKMLIECKQAALDISRRLTSTDRNSKN